MVVFGLAVHSVAGSILLWGHFPVEGIFPLELTWVQTPFPKKTLSDESTYRGLVCARVHFIARLKRSWRSCPRRVNAGNKNTPSTHHPRRRNVTTLMVGLKKRSHTQKSHPKIVNPRDIAGERRRREEEEKSGSGYMGLTHSGQDKLPIYISNDFMIQPRKRSLQNPSTRQRRIPLR